MSHYQAIRGMNDILPHETPLWRFIESTLETIVSSYGYDEIRFPIVETTAVFTRAIGEVTDIVEKEMYTFLDRNGDSLSLRPEGTACCVRAGIEHGLLHNQIQRLWYRGPFFRHERPQKGRYRQFHQFSAECFGLADASADAELILLSKRILHTLGLLPYTTLEINTLGSFETRKQHRQALLAYLHEHASLLDEDSQRRLTTNPLRILDSKNPAMQAMIEQAPALMDFLDIASQQHFDELRRYLDVLCVDYIVNPRLVRGLDYYCHTVFEWTTQRLGAQGTVCAGGRYDGLVEQLGAKSTPAVGFAIGLERLALMMTTLEKLTSQAPPPKAYVIPEDTTAMTRALQVSESLRDTGRIITGSPTGLKHQMKRADKSGALYAIIVTQGRDTLTVKPLRQDLSSQDMLPDACHAWLDDAL